MFFQLRGSLRDNVVHNAACNECHQPIRGTRYKVCHVCCNEIHVLNVDTVYAPTLRRLRFVPELRGVADSCPSPGASSSEDQGQGMFHPVINNMLSARWSSGHRLPSVTPPARRSFRGACKGWQSTPLAPISIS